ETTPTPSQGSQDPVSTSLSLSLSPSLSLSLSHTHFFSSFVLFTQYPSDPLFSSLQVCLLCFCKFNMFFLCFVAIALSLCLSLCRDPFLFLLSKSSCLPCRKQMLC